MESVSTLYSIQQIKLQLELIVNRKLYQNNKIMKDTYLKVEQDILRELKKKNIN